MGKIYVIILVIILSVACSSKKNNSHNKSEPVISKSKMETVVDSLLYFRHHAKQTDLLSREFPNLPRQKAIEIQLAMLKKELEAGASQIGWKMGGTIAKDSANYAPLFGYILDSNLIQEDSTVRAENFPGGSVMVEGEIGFVINKDLRDGAESLNELKKGIKYVTSAVEFAKSTAAPIDGDTDALNINYTLASGMGQAGILIGAGKTNVEDFDMNHESVRCFIDDALAAQGSSENIYGGPLHALYSLVNMLPKYGLFLKKGDVVITGSLYDNPTIKSTSEVRLAYSTLGSIHFSMK